MRKDVNIGKCISNIISSKDNFISIKYMQLNNVSYLTKFNVQ